MLKIDSHQHFWKFDALRDSWITDQMSVLRNDFLPEQLSPLLQEHKFDGCIVVQSDQSMLENVFQLQHASDHPFIKGVVGWVDLQSDLIEEQLEALSVHAKLKGFRHILQGEKDRALMLRPAFLNGIGKLKAHNFTYDLLILPDQLKFAAELVSRFPDQPFVLDHIAKPDIKNQIRGNWEADLKALAKYQQVYCKVSGMVTEADWANWKEEELIPYLDVVFEAFGTDRVMFGSDWPVSLLAASYGKWVAVMNKYVSKFSTYEQQQFWGGNATTFYKLK